jgi:hypothetical protein
VVVNRGISRRAGETSALAVWDVVQVLEDLIGVCHIEEVGLIGVFHIEEVGLIDVSNIRPSRYGMWCRFYRCVRVRVRV